MEPTKRPEEQSRDNGAVIPCADLYRAAPAAELRAPEEGVTARLATMTGHFAVFNQWTEINSMWEGQFLERIAPGAFKKTIRENTPKVLFQHGQDPMIGDKPLGPIETLEEDSFGARYEVPLLDTTYNRDLLPALREGLYGASFRFSVVREDIDNEPELSDHNPGGLPERTVKEVRLMEFGPVTFPAYSGATAVARSLTDEFRAAPTPTPETPPEPIEDGPAPSPDDGDEPESESAAKPIAPAPAPPRATPTAPLYPNRKDTPSWRI